MKIWYGAGKDMADVTELCKEKFGVQDLICIPSGDLFRASVLGDPKEMAMKQIVIQIGANEAQESMPIVCDHTQMAVIDTNTKKVELFDHTPPALREHHEKVKFVHGNPLLEFPEQRILTHFIDGSETVLEIGANLGRSTAVIARRLGCNQQSNKQRLVSLECDQANAQHLIENLQHNNLHVSVGSFALSEHRLCQKGWDTVPFEGEQPPSGFTEVPTKTYKQFIAEYPQTFDTLVLDCEGAFYYILKDTPQILDTVKKVIVENDYLDPAQQKYVETQLLARQFRLVYNEALVVPYKTAMDFYQVWQRK